MIETLIQDSIVTVCLNRPEKRNALNLEMLTLLRDAIQQAGQRSDIRLLVLRGNGNVFCAGADLDFVRQLSEEAVAKEFAGLLSNLLEEIRSFPVPVLVQVQGACMGGANGILAAADIVIAEINTRFAFSEVKLGLVPAIISPYVLSKLPISRAFDLLITGRIFDATEAKHAGLITYTGTEGEIDFLFRQTATQILSSAPSAIKYTRKIIWDYILQNSWEDNVKQSCELFVSIATSAEAKEGINAFFEKRNPKWTGNGNGRIKN
jgi:methylglutaconyl-CoA hydratase